MSQALVSCLTVTENRVPLLRRAVRCFQHQTLEPRELVVVHGADDQDTSGYVASLDDARIRAISAPPGSALGARRNFAADQARGEFIAVWDDDDWYAPERLSTQVQAMAQTGKAACFLSRLMLFDLKRQTLAISTQRAWDGSLVVRRSELPRYADELTRGEDRPVRTALLEAKAATFVQRPELYVYTYHGANTCSAEHWQQLFANARPLRADQEGALLARMAS